MISARGTHEIVDVEITLAKLPRALDGVTIVQLSDLHVGLTIDREFVQGVVDQTNRLSPDLVALTGDLVDGTVEDLRDDFAPLGSLRDRWYAALHHARLRVLGAARAPARASRDHEGDPAERVGTVHDRSAATGLRS